MDIWFGVWIMVSDYGLSHSDFFSSHDSACICFYPSVSHVLAHLKKSCIPLAWLLYPICRQLVYIM